MIRPNLEAEAALLAAGACCVAGIDEVGRGALAGPVSVGVVLVDAQTGAIPDGLADSKLISSAVRERLRPRLEAWCLAFAIGHAEPEEIDEVGIIAALRVAAVRALALLPVAPAAVILDGSHDWLTPRDDLFSESSPPTPPVHMRVKADQACASVAAASVLAKVVRDARMRELDAAFPGYGLASHKGYGSAEHRDAILRLGPSTAHRRSWNLTGA